MTKNIYDSHGNVITQVATDYNEYNEGVKLVYPCRNDYIRDNEKDEESKIMLLR